MNRRTEVAIYVVSALLLIGTATIWWQGVRPSPSAPALQQVGVVEEAGSGGESNSGDQAVNPVEKSKIFVHIDGAVQKPGVYELEEGQRLFQALELVGLSDDADISSLNLAGVLRDSQKVHVPKAGEAPVTSSGESDASGGDSAGSNSAFPVNVNTASQAELETLPGVGPVIARAIIARREEIGYFRRVEDLLEVTGIGEKTLARMSGLVVVQ